MKLILILCGVGIFIAFIFLLYLRRTWVFLPTKSSPRALTFTVYKKDYRTKPVITLRHYVDGMHVCDYTLTIENGVHIEEPQSYALPKIDKGRVEVNINLQDENGNFTIIYNQADDFYKKGLLIYLTEGKTDSSSVIYSDTVCDRYVYLVSGEKKICYFKGRDSSEWSIIMDPLSLKGIKIKELSPAIIDSPPKWEKNEWVVMSVNNKPDN